MLSERGQGSGKGWGRRNYGRRGCRWEVTVIQIYFIGTFLDKSYGLCLQVPYVTTRRENNWLVVDGSNYFSSINYMALMLKCLDIATTPIKTIKLSVDCGGHKILWATSTASYLYKYMNSLLRLHILYWQHKVLHTSNTVQSCTCVMALYKQRFSTQNFSKKRAHKS